MRNNRFTLAQVDTFLDTVRKDGWAINTEVNEVGSFTLHSCTRREPEYLGGSWQILIVVRHARKGGRASVKVTTIRRYCAQNFLKDVKKTGAWDAWYAVRDIKATWDRHNEREARASTTATTN